MKKKLLSTFLSLCIMVVMLAVFSVTSYAAGFRYYRQGDSNIIITGSQNVQNGTLIIPSSVDDLTVIGIDDGAFKGRTDIKSVEIADGITTIGKDAFKNCTRLQNIVIHGSVTIGKGAFDGTGYYNTSSNWQDGALYLGKYLIAAQKDLFFLSIKKGTLAITESAFEGCSYLVNVIIPSGLKYVYKNAFKDCSRLENIEIPEGLLKIEEGAFTNCNNITNVFYTGSKKNWSLAYIGPGNEPLTDAPLICESGLNDARYTYKILNDEAIITKCDQLLSGDVVIPKTIGRYAVTAIADNAFKDITASESIVIPDSVKSIGNEAFAGCTSLKSIVIPDSVTSIGDRAFSNCISLKSIKIPNGIKGISYCMFGGCTILESVELPDSITTIADYAFDGCENLKNIKIPDGVTNIGSNVFDDTKYYNTNSNWQNGVLYMGNHLIDVKSVSENYTVKNGTLTIADNAFSGCTGLKNITIPGSVTTIGDDAFSGCTILESVVLPDKITSIGANVFYGTKIYNTPENWENGVLYIGKYLIGAKKDLSGKYSIKSGTYTIADGAFAACATLSHIGIPQGVTNIGDSAFEGCKGLRSVDMSSNVTNIGDRAFYDCKGLNSIELPNDITEIGDKVFHACVNLQHIDMPDKLKSIGDGAFYGCGYLQSIDIPGSVTSIGEGAFGECPGLMEVYYMAPKDKWNEVLIGENNDRLFYAKINCRAEITSIIKTKYGDDTMVKVEVSGMSEYDRVFVAGYSKDGNLLEVKKVTIENGCGSEKFPSGRITKYKAFIVRTQLKPIS